MTKALAISRFLRALADAVEHMTDDEVEMLLRREGLAGVLHSQKSKRSIDETDRQTVRDDALRLMNELVSAHSREEAASLLERLNVSRSVLTAAARLRDVHVQKQDTNATIKTKLIENVVGSRLDSAAIRGG